MKRIVSLVLALSMVLGLCATSFAAVALTDVAGTDYAAAVEALIELEVVTGYPDGTYKPEKEVNRAELAKMIVICMGLEEDAERAQADNIFTDESLKEGEAYAWARGYVNTAAAAGVIKGYPTGDFKPEKTVTYAEALTMMLRALGYGNVMEEQGTWPTNALLLAREYKLTRDVAYDNSSDGAVRGDIAILLWNMLRTPMWKITSENQGTGMTSEASKIMLNVKFPDYEYAEVIFEGFEVEDGEDEAEVRVSFEEVEGSFIYEKNDFYKFVPGTTVEVLVNHEDELLLSMVSAGEDKLVEGACDVLDEDYDELDDVAYEYGFARIVRRAVADATLLTASSVYVDELEAKANKDYIKINGEKYEDDDYDFEVILKDGERVELRDIEEGDILTTVTVTYLVDESSEVFYVIGGEEAEGELTRLSNVTAENSEKTFDQLTVSKVKYVVDANATYVEDPEEEDYDVEDLLDGYVDEMEGEEVVLKLDGFFGKVVRVEFDGKIDSGAEEDSTVAFYGVEEDIDRNGRTYSIGLVNEEGSVELDYAKNSDAEGAAQESWAAAEDEVGSFVWVELDEEGKIINKVLVADYEGGFAGVVKTDVPYGDGENEYYAFLPMEAAKYEEDDEELVAGNDKMSVSEDTTVVTIIFDDKGTNKDSDDEYRIEFAQGLEALEDIKNDDVVVIYDADETFTEAKYVLVWSDASDKSNNRVAKVVSPEENEVYVGGAMIDLEDEDDDELTYKLADNTGDVSDLALIVYTITTNTKGKEILNFVAGLNNEELVETYELHGYVGECKTGRRAIINGNEEKLDSEEWTDLYEDYMVVLVEVEETEVDGEYEVAGFEVMDYASASLKEADRIAIRDAETEVIFLIRGMDKIEDNK